MKFVYPEFLFALAALAIPIIIHLFSFRKFKKIFFTNVRFLQEIKKDTQSRTRLKHLLVLISRLLALSFLVLAFAKPFFPENNLQKVTDSNVVSIFIDNSFSMEAVGKNGKLLDETKRKAKEIIASFDASSQFQILTNEFEARHQRLYNKEQALEITDEIHPGSASKSLSEIISRQTDALKSSNSGSSKNSFILSDFQKSICDFQNMKADSTIRWQLIPIQATKSANLFIDSCWFSTPVMQKGIPLELIVRMNNNSAAIAENVPCKLFINGKQKGLSSFTIEPNEKLELKIPFTISDTGLQSGFASISDFPVTFDDNYYFSFEAANRLPILCINGGETNKFLTGVYADDSLFSFKNISEKQIDYSALSAYSVIILNELKSLSSGLREELKKYIAQGGTVTLFPASEIEASTYNDFLNLINTGISEKPVAQETKISKMSTQDDLMNNVFEKIPENLDYPLVKKYFTFNSHNRSGSEEIMKMQNGSPFLTKSAYEKGKVFLFACPASLEFSSFPKHALFVPVMFRMALLSVPNVARSYTIGREDAIETGIIPTGAETALHLKKMNGVFDVIPESKNINGKVVFFLHGQIAEAGNYLVGESQLLSAISFNYDRKESSLDSYDINELSAKANASGIQVMDVSKKSFSSMLSESAAGKPLWKYCIILALIFLAIEVFLLRFLK